MTTSLLAPESLQFGDVRLRPRVDSFAFVRLAGLAVPQVTVVEAVRVRLEFPAAETLRSASITEITLARLAGRVDHGLPTEVTDVRLLFGVLGTPVARLIAEGLQVIRLAGGIPIQRCQILNGIAHTIILGVIGRNDNFCFVLLPSSLSGASVMFVPVGELLPSPRPLAARWHFYAFATVEVRVSGDHAPRKPRERTHHNHTTVVAEVVCCCFVIFGKWIAEAAVEP